MGYHPLPEHLCVSRIEQTLDPDVTLAQRRHDRAGKHARLARWFLHALRVAR